MYSSEIVLHPACVGFVRSFIRSLVCFSSVACVPFLFHFILFFSVFVVSLSVPVARISCRFPRTHYVDLKCPAVDWERERDSADDEFKLYYYVPGNRKKYTCHAEPSSRVAAFGYLLCVGIIYQSFGAPMHSATSFITRFFLVSLFVAFTASSMQGDENVDKGIEREEGRWELKTNMSV